MRHEGSVTIERPIDEVFDLTINHVVEWSNVVVEDELLKENPGGVGSTFRTATEDHGCRMEFHGVVTRFEPPRYHAVGMAGDRFDIDAEYAFEDLGGRTRVSLTSAVAGKGVFKLLLIFFGWAMHTSSCSAQQDELNSLKRFCEERAAANADRGVAWQLT